MYSHHILCTVYPICIYIPCKKTSRSFYTSIYIYEYIDALASETHKISRSA